MTQDQIRLAVQQSANYESAHDRRNCYAIRKPIYCVVCESPAPSGPTCDGCRMDVAA